MKEDSKAKIHIAPKQNRFNNRGNYKENEDLKQELKRLKKQVGRLTSIAEHEENIIETYRGHNVILSLIDGSSDEGRLKKITKFQFVVEINGQDFFYYKSSIIKFCFPQG